jgi:hypothetical protein
MDAELEPKPPGGDPGAKARDSKRAWLRGREGLRSALVLLIILAAVACLFLVGKFAR